MASTSEALTDEKKKQEDIFTKLNRALGVADSPEWQELKWTSYKNMDFYPYYFSNRMTKEKAYMLWDKFLQFSENSYYIEASINHDTHYGKEGYSVHCSKADVHKQLEGPRVKPVASPAAERRSPQPLLPTAASNPADDVGIKFTPDKSTSLHSYMKILLDKDPNTIEFIKSRFAFNSSEKQPMYYYPLLNFSTAGKAASTATLLQDFDSSAALLTHASSANSSVAAAEPPKAAAKTVK